MQTMDDCASLLATETQGDSFQLISPKTSTSNNHMQTGQETHIFT